MIKEICIPIKVDRLGHIIKIGIQAYDQEDLVFWQSCIPFASNGANGNKTSGN